MKRFVISDELCTTGFNEHITLDLFRPIEDQLKRRYLYHRSGHEKGNPSKIKTIIAANSSLRIAFGWSFESATIYEKMMQECTDTICPRYNIIVNMQSDNRCDWLGFSPFNVFEKVLLDDLDLYRLMLFNNELVDFQTDVIQFISTHKSFLDHSLIRNNDYRFKFYKNRRKDPAALSDAFHCYIEAINNTTGITSISRNFVEEYIGCHYLNYPEIFFELLNFYTLKGRIYEE